ncbi:MAG: hypothetical protein DMD85_21650 [Candidatus Rokuibacteriota bacterium]|nr:MAG: hypothetical protein DMD85_21650 [Candidatus Rokubacteria bacterium]
MHGSIRASGTADARDPHRARPLRSPQHAVGHRRPGRPGHHHDGLDRPAAGAARSAQGRLPSHEQAARCAELPRHRPGGARHAEPRHLWRAHIAVRRVLRGDPRNHRRLAVGGGLRLSPGPLRSLQPADHGDPAVVMPYVEAGRASGASALRIMALHVLPQCIAPYLVLATTHLGAAIVIEAALGFLGVGVPPPTPTWGNMLADSITALVPPWWLAFFPGLAITVTVLAFNLLGDGIRDTLDPRLSPAFLRMMAGGRRA